MLSRPQFLPPYFFQILFISYRVFTKMVEIVYTAFIFLITSLLPLSSPFTLVDPEYNKNVRPREGERPDEVKIGLFINSIRTVSEVDMVAVLDVFVQVRRSKWDEYDLPFHCFFGEYDSVWLYCPLSLFQALMGKKQIMSALSTQLTILKRPSGEIIVNFLSIFFQYYDLFITIHFNFPKKFTYIFYIKLL